MAKRSLMIVLLLATVLLVACGQQETTKAPEEGKVSVGFAAASAGWPWYATFIETLEARAEEADWDLTVLGAGGDVATQVDQIEDLIAAGVDYLIVGPTDGTAVVPGIKKADEAGIKVIVIGNVVDPEADEAITAVRVPDDYQMGKDSAELMVEALDGEGKIIVVEGLPGQPAVIKRKEAYDDVFSETDIEIADSQPANWDSTKAVEVTEAMLTAHPDIDGILSMDGSMTPGIVQVVEERGLDVPIVGLGGTASELELVKEGKVYGTTCMSPGANAEAAADAIQGLVNGEDVEKVKIVPSPKTTQENADECPGDW